MTNIAWDIESVPCESSMALPYPEAGRQPPSNYTTPDAKARWMEKDRKDWEHARLRDYSVNPRLGRICAIGFCTDDDAFYHVAKTEADEPELLKTFWKIMQPTGGDFPQWITWNGSFDIRFVLLRSIKHRIQPSWSPSQVSTSLARYRYRPHADVKAALLNWDVRQKGEGLSEWSEFFGMDKKISHGSEVYEMAQRGEWTAIGEYAQDDAAKTMSIYTKIANYLI